MLIAFVFIRFFITDSEKEEDFPEFKEMEAAKTSHELNAIEHLLKKHRVSRKVYKILPKSVIAERKTRRGSHFPPHR